MRPLIFLWFGLIATWHGNLSTVTGQEAAPAKKDSSARLQPKSVVWKTSVVPSTAKPGDTVRLTLTAELQPGYHIYKLTKTQPDTGPRQTEIDFFDKGGLEPVGDWTASKPLKKVKEPAFDDLEVESWDGTVSFSIDLKVPANVTSGEKSLKAQVYYQLCNDKNCSIPGRWTLSPAKLTIEGGLAAAKVEKSPPAKATQPVAVAPPKVETAATPEPKLKDSPAKLAPSTVKWTTKAEPATAKPGDTVKLTLTASLAPDWHLYKLTDKQPEVGPRQTELDLFDTGGLKIAGEWTASKELKREVEEAFAKEVPFVEFWDGEVSFSIDLKVPHEISSGPKSLKVQAFYQVCSDKSCWTEGRWTLPTAILTIADRPSISPENLGQLEPIAQRSDTEAPQKITEPALTAAATPAPAEAPSAPGPDTAAVPTVAAAPSETTGVPEPAVVTDVQKSLDQGLIPFLLVCAGGGLVALIMPCVWPMVPVTVNFFVKQGQNGASTTKLAVSYCLAIIGIFTMVGVAFSAFFGAASLQTVANHPYLNFFIAALFFAFGLSLLGLFEIRLPNFLLNASAKGEGKGGMVGVMFMAATLTITSFTCTFPVVGGLLVMASKGNYLYPVLGLATFATVIAIPFFLLALSPSLLSKMPKGGDWMNTVKTVGGLVEIGAAFKFLNTAEIAYTVPEEAWFDAQTVLSIWVVLAAVCGLYLLGFFRTDHDYEEPKVGPGRMIFGCSFLFLSLYMAPALFGRPPQSQIYSRLIVGILPPDAGELAANVVVVAPGGEGGSPAHGTKATSPDPQVAMTQQTSFHGVVWGFSLDQAKEKAKTEKKPILIDFTGVNCANCRLMEQRVLPRPEVVDLMKNFVTVQIYTDIVPIPSITPAQRLELAQANQELLIDIAQEATNPIYVVMAPDGKVLERVGGYNEPTAFVAFLNRALGKFEPTKMAAK